MANYSDREMLAFSDIAYERSLSDYDSLVANSAKYPNGKVPLSDLLPASRINDISSTYGIPADTIRNWKVASSPGDRNGFFACVIETSPEHAAVAFRGSQDMLDPEAALTDWRHNLQLLNRTCTEQQSEADRFIAANRELLNSYESVGMTGHSLGGNLAEYSTIMAGKNGIGSSVDQCVNLDGPGFNHDFIQENQSAINAAQDIITHYKWSLVGELFDSKIGNVQYADTKPSESGGLAGELDQHDRKYATNFDKSGNLITTDHAKGNLAGWIKTISSNLDNMPDWYRDIVYYTYGLGFIGLITFAGTVKNTIEYIGEKIGDAYNWAKDKWNSFTDGVASFFGFGKSGSSTSGGGGGHSFGSGRHSFGGGRHFSSGSANVIKVSTEDMAACVSSYMSQKARLMDALSICNNAAQTLAQSWAGPSFLQMSLKLADTWKNLSQSMAKIDDAVDELKKVISIMDSTEKKIVSTVASLDTGSSPFA